MVGLLSRRLVVCGTGLALAAASWLVWKAQAARSAALATIAVAGAPALVGADDVRTFAVSVDGKPGGTYTISTATAADGTETISLVAAVKVKTTFYTYTYELNSVEVWKDGQLISLDSTSNDDGKKRTLTAALKDRELSVTVNRESRKIGASVITSSGVRVPTGDKARDTVMFDNEDGTDTAVRVEPLGAGRVTLNGQAIDGSRFKVTGKDIAAEWWFDKNGRVIQQEMKWDGHKVVLQLTNIK